MIQFPNPIFNSLTASTFQQLKEHREKLARRVAKTKQISEDVIVRGNLKNGFDKNYTKYTHNLVQIRSHNDFLKKRLRAFMVGAINLCTDVVYVIYVIFK
jgi:hypothetical protein